MKIKNALYALLTSVFFFTSALAAPMYYTVEGVIISGYGLPDYGLYLGYPVKYVFIVDTEELGTNTLSTGEVYVYEDWIETYEHPDCSGGICEEWQHYFHADHIYGDYATWDTSEIPLVLEFNFMYNRYRETSWAEMLSASGAIDSVENEKRISKPISDNGHVEDWALQDTLMVTEHYGEDFFNAEVYIIEISDTSPLMTVAIDVEPKRNSIVRLKRKGSLSVAILSSESFDATQIDPESIRFGLSGTAITEEPKTQDVNGDDFADLLVRFNTAYSWIQCGDTQVTLTAETFDGEMITGTDSISTAQCN